MLRHNINIFLLAKRRQTNRGTPVDERELPLMDICKTRNALLWLCKYFVNLWRIGKRKNGTWIDGRLSTELGKVIVTRISLLTYVTPLARRYSVKERYVAGFPSCCNQSENNSSLNKPQEILLWFFSLFCLSIPTVIRIN